MSSAAPDGVKPDVVVVDYGLGNLRSVRRGLERAGAGVGVSADPATILAADGVVLPGVGAFSEGVENAGPFRETLLEVAHSETPLFGICLGMQMLLTDSEEATNAGDAEVRGLDLIPGTNVRFEESLTVPHMGWNQLERLRDHPLTAGLDGEYAYFVHSYHASPENTDATVARTEYGGGFPSVIADADNRVFGTQFHPEKSGDTGLALLENFVALCAESG